MTGEESSSETPDLNAPTTPGAAAQYYFENSAENFQAEDPNPPAQNADNETKEAYIEEVNEYAREMLETLTSSNLRGKELWEEFAVSFRPGTMKYMNKTLQFSYVNLLRKQGVSVERRQFLARSEALKNCLKKFTPMNIEDSDDHNTESSNQKDHEELHGATRDKCTSGTRTEALNKKQNDQNIDEEDITVVNNGKKIEFNIPNLEKRSKQNDSRNEFTAGGNFNLGLNGLMKAYQGRDKYSGRWDEDLNSALQLYDTLSNLCRLEEHEKAEAMPVMLKSDALSYYSSFYKSGMSYDEVVRKLSEWYTSPEQKGRILRLWQGLRLTEAMKEEPEKSEVEVFRSFSFKLTTLQKQLSRHYQHDDFLRDQIIIATDIPNVQQSLRERIPSSAQEAVNRIATFLSHHPKTAGAYISNESNSEESSAMYSLGQKFGGGARKESNGGHKYKTKNHRISPNWLRGIKGCYVCGKAHRARSRHSPSEVKEAIQRIKNSNPTAMLSASDLAFIADELIPNEDEEDDENVVLSEEEEEEFNESAFVANDEHGLNKGSEILLSNQSFLHGTTFAKDMEMAMASMSKDLKMGEEEIFKGIYIDTCANRSSIMSLKQYKAYCNQFNAPFHIEPDTKKISGIGGSSQTLGSAVVPVPFKGLDLVVDIKFQIMRDCVPTLLSLKDMLDNELDISIQDREITFCGKSHKLLLENYFLIHRWGREDIHYVLFSEAELRTLHRSFGHPSSSALYNLLKRAHPEKVNTEIRKELDKIVEECKACIRNSRKPRRFKLTVGADELRFNHTIAVDVMYIDNRPILHIVDEATHYCAAQFLRNNSSREVWKTILRCWSRIYLGPPDFLHVDQGSNFTSQEFRESAEADGIRIIEAPIESPGSISHVERYHAPLRASYLKIRQSLPRSETDAECLQLAVKSCNDVMGPEGLCPTLLVFGAIPRPARKTPAADQLERARVLDAAMTEVQKEQSKRRVAFGLKHTHGSKGLEESENLRKLPAGAPVYVFRQKSNCWEGPFSFIEITGETVVVQMPSGRKIFRSTVVKPANKSLLDENHDRHSNVYFCEQTCTALFGASNVEIAKKTDSWRFEKARKEEIKGLLDNGTFEIVKKSSVEKGARIYGTRFVDAVKTVNNVEKLRSRLVAKNYDDNASTLISTKAPTVQRVSQRIALSSAATNSKSHKSYLRDITQAYPQSNDPLQRKVYLKPPPEMGLSDDDVLLAVGPLYGIPESGLHWFMTYQPHHIEELGMKACQVDPCLLYKRQKGQKLEGLTIMQVDDTFGHGDEQFLQTENEKAKFFKSKPRHILKEGQNVVFNGCQIKLNADGSYELHNSDKLERLEKVKTAEEFISARAAIQYIGVSTRPDLCAPAQLLATTVDKVNDQDIKDLNKLIKFCKETKDIGLKFVPIDMDSARLLLFTDASFANTKDLKSQLGFLNILVDKHGNMNIINFGSSRCKRVTRSVMAAEIHALIYGFDHTFVLQHTLGEIYGKCIPIEGFVDSKTLFNVIARFANTLEKRLQIDVFSIRECLDNKELESLSWLPGEKNPSDPLTKFKLSTDSTLWKMLRTNKFKLNPTGWVRFEKRKD